MTDLQTKDFGLSIKALSDEGTFEGYGSIFGNVDSYGEKVMPGAFAKSLARHKAEGSNVLMLWNHQRDNPIGVWEELVEDHKGLRGKGRLFLDIQRGREVHTLIKHSAIGGLSIGYTEVNVTEKQGSEPRRLNEVHLYEISPVTFPANRRATITSVKGEISTRSDFITALRDLGYSRSAAEKIAAGGYAALAGDDPETAIKASSLLGQMDAALHRLKGL